MNEIKFWILLYILGRFIHEVRKLEYGCEPGNIVYGCAMGWRKVLNIVCMIISGSNDCPRLQFKIGK